MKKSATFIALSASIVFSACSDMPSSIETDRIQAVISETDCKYSTRFGCSDGVQTYAESDTVPMHQEKLFALVFSQALLGDFQIKSSTRLQIAGLSAPAPSDTVPGPAPVGAVHSLYAKQGGAAFASILSMFSAGAPQPSDTVPGPGPVGNVKIANYDGVAGNEVVVYLNSKQLNNVKSISPSTTQLVLFFTNGKTTIALPGAPVTIIGPETEEVSISRK